MGLDYRLSDDALLYIVSRRGYRAGAPNTPLFESPYTTGGIAPGCQFTTPPATGQCPDFRPYQVSGEEKVTDVELGLKTSFELQGARGHFHIDAFYRSEEHTSELQSLMRISYAVSCLTTKTEQSNNTQHPRKATVT